RAMYSKAAISARRSRTRSARSRNLSPARWLLRATRHPGGPVRRPCSFLPGHPQHFLQGGHPFAYLAHAIVADARPEHAGVAGQLLFRGSVMDQRAHRIIEHHQFVDTGPTAVAELAAFVAA